MRLALRTGKWPRQCDTKPPIIMPRHVAIIMDGNGRWANARGLPRTAGHRAGVERVREAVRTAAEAGIEYLTLFAFSSEKLEPSQGRSVRPDGEKILRFFLRRDLAELHRENVCVKVIGCRETIQPDIRGEGALLKRGRGPHPRQHRRHSDHRLQLRCARRARPRRPLHRGGGSLRPDRSRNRQRGDACPPISTPPAFPIPTW